MKQTKKTLKAKTKAKQLLPWYKIKRNRLPIIGLAPMAGVSDEPFRLVVAKYGKPSFIFTAFIWPEAILSMSPEALENITYAEEEKPIIAQIVGSNPELFYKITPILCELGFDGIDINMGCPDKHILARGAGAALIKNPILAKQLAGAVKQSIRDWAQGKPLEDYGYTAEEIRFWKERKQALHLKLPKKRNLIPVSLKTRIGYTTIDLKWLQFIINEIKPEVLSLHVRTLKENRRGKGHWEIMDKIVPLAKKNRVALLGNGGIISYDEAISLIKKYNLDGIMIAQGALGNPWLFKNENPTPRVKLKVALEQAKIYKKMYGEKRFFTLRKHLLWYTSGLKNSKNLRKQLGQVNTYNDCQAIIAKYLKDGTY